MSASKWKPYPEMKESGFTWSGKIPNHWGLKPIKFFARLKQEKSDIIPSGMPYIALEHIESGTGIFDIDRNITEIGSSVSLFSRGDVLFGKLRPYLAKVIRPEFDGCCSSELIVLEDNPKMDSLFLKYLLLSPVFIDHINATTNGVKMPRASPDSFGSITIPIPKLAEQNLIGEFLEKKNETINKKILIFRNMLLKCKEKRSILINNALINTQNEEMRLGHAVEHIFRPVERIPTEIYHPLGLYNRGRGIFEKPPKLGAELGDSEFFYVKAGDLILSGQFAWEGAIALADEHHSGCVVSHRYPVVKGKPGFLDSAYLQAFFNTEYGDFILNQHSIGAAGRNRPLNIGTLLKEKIPIPSIEEQLEVSKLVYLEKKIRAVFENHTELLNEYRKELISAAVTGKIDIRESV